MSQTPSRLLTLNELLMPVDIARLLWHRTFTSEAIPTLPPVPTIVLPGLGSSDLSTLVLRQSLSRTGLQVYKGGIGRNNGDLKRLIALSEQHLQTVFEQTQQQVILMGWSLGGIIAREVTRSHPSMVKAVCCLGSPIVGGGRYSAYAPVYERKGYDLEQMEELCAQRERVPLKVPSLSVYSKKDGIVFWEASIDRFNEHTDNIEVSCRHFSMGFSASVYQVLYDWLEKTLSTT